MYSYHHETRAEIAASPDDLFAELDDQERLSVHMMKSSAMMMGSSMRFESDERRGRAVGSRMRLYGKVLGLPIEVLEHVVERDPPRRKVWETLEEPRLLVIGPYRMGFDIRSKGSGAELVVFIDYDMPPGAWRLAGRILGGIYARWCTQSMARGAAARFAKVRSAA